MLNTMQARADEKRASLIPKNSPVLRYMSSVYAIAGKRLVLLAAEQHHLGSLVYSLDKVHSNDTCDGSIREGIGEVSPVMWQAALDVVIDAVSWTKDSITTPSFDVIEIVRRWLCLLPFATQR